MSDIGVQGRLGSLGIQLSAKTAAVGLGADAAYQGYGMGFDGKSLGSAAKSFAIEAPLFVAGSGMAAESGLTASKLGLTGKSLAFGAAAGGTKFGLNMSEGMSFKNALKEGVMDVPLYASGFGMAGNAGAAAGDALVANAQANAVKALGDGATEEEQAAAAAAAAREIGTAPLSDSAVHSAANSALRKGATTAFAFDGGIGAAVPLAMDGYETYSPIEIGGMMPDHMQLNPNNPEQANQIWENYGNVNPNLYSAPDETASGSAADQSAPARQLTQSQINDLMNQPIEDQ